MNPKIKKINTEYEKNAAKITELQARQEELAKQRTELEHGPGPRPACRAHSQRPARCAGGRGGQQP